MLLQILAIPVDRLTKSFLKTFMFSQLLT